MSCDNHRTSATGKELQEMMAYARKSPLDAMREECGIAAVYGHDDAARLVYLSLYALQHRGQEPAGIVTSNGTGLHSKVAMGLVADIFDKPALDGLTGRHAIGHVRYSTAGDSSSPMKLVRWSVIHRTWQ